MDKLLQVESHSDTEKNKQARRCLLVVFCKAVTDKQDMPFPLHSEGKKVIGNVARFSVHFVTYTSCLGQDALPHLSSDQQSQTCSLWLLWFCKAGFLLTHTLEKNASIYKGLMINASVSCVLCALLCQLSSVTDASSPRTLNTGDPQLSVHDPVFSLYAKSLC